MGGVASRCFGRPQPAGASRPMVHNRDDSAQSAAAPNPTHGTGAYLVVRGATSEGHGRLSSAHRVSQDLPSDRNVSDEPPCSVSPDTRSPGRPPAGRVDNSYGTGKWDRCRRSIAWHASCGESVRPDLTLQVRSWPGWSAKRRAANLNPDGREPAKWEERDGRSWRSLLLEIVTHRH
jgi:hypothetical protein